MASRQCLRRSISSSSSPWQTSLHSRNALQLRTGFRMLPCMGQHYHAHTRLGPAFASEARSRCFSLHHGRSALFAYTFLGGGRRRDAYQSSKADIMVRTSCLYGTWSKIPLADKIVKVPEMAESISEGTLKQWSKRSFMLNLYGWERQINGTKTLHRDWGLRRAG